MSLRISISSQFHVAPSRVEKVLIHIEGQRLCENCVICLPRAAIFNRTLCTLLTTIKNKQIDQNAFKSDIIDMCQP